MGYNGSNRKGYDRRYRGLSKSSMKSGNSMLFGKKGIVTGLFDIGSSIAEDTTNYDTPRESNTIANTEVNINMDIGDALVYQAKNENWLLLICVSILWIIGFGLGLFGFLILTLGITSFIIGVIGFCCSSTRMKKLRQKNKKKSIAYANEIQEEEVLFTPNKKISPELTDKLLKDFGLECYFHFMRPPLSEEEYNETEFSVEFKKAFFLYEGYIKQWGSIYWHYSFESKVHQMLIQLLSEEFIKADDEFQETRFYNMLYNRIAKVLNKHERNYYAIVQRNDVSMQSFLNYYYYKNMWMTNQYEPNLIGEKLKKDILNRQESCLHNTYIWYGGKWSPSYPFVVEQFDKIST